MRKFSGEMFDAAPTVVAMGRQAEFNSMINERYWTRFQLSPLYFGSIGRSNFYGMLVDTIWATISMAVVISMRGQMAPAVAIAVFNQLEELNSLVGTFFSYNDAAAQTLPNWMQVQEFLEVTECVGKSCIEDDNRPPPPGWPSDGRVHFNEIYFDYREGAPCALNGITCEIESGQKIGVCGRTGAGKSTLLSVLFSLGPLKAGTVSIGGKDLAGISCHEVRANVAIVPQSPTLFEGTVRENLIGGNRRTVVSKGDGSDDYLLETLNTCRLSNLVERGLDGTMGQLSDGQRQLFCVARALVRKPKILVLDESTADLDQDSANELLRVIDENFTDTTVIR
jgi:ABC-type multidrug transport system fused ATPase/permease subunit